jgi:hypothetical protein
MTQFISGAGGGNSAQKRAEKRAKRQQKKIKQQLDRIEQKLEPYKPTEAPDSLESAAYAYLLDLIGEGEIQGLENSWQSVLLDDTPLMNPDGTFNFSGVQIETRYGTQNQSYIQGFSDIQREVGVNIELKYNASQVRQITDTNVNAARVTISLPALQFTEEDGDIVGTSVRMTVDVQYNGGSYSTVIDDTITGKSSSAYQRDYRFPISGAFPVNIRVTRLTEDSTTVRLQNATFWTAYTEIIDQKLRYPNTALVALKFDAQQFGAIPTRAYLMRGIKVAIPSNATVDTSTYPGRITYSGVWGGTFAAAQWTSDPAWCLWDLLTNTRYGAALPAASLDKFSFYAISQYCNELLPNGFGGLEPRFSCNVNIQTEEEAFNLIEEMTTIFRGMAWWSAGSVALSCDRPVDSSYLLTPANVVEGLFVYEGSSLKSRHTVCIVQYMDMDKRDVAYEYVEDAAAVSKYGLIVSQLSAFACNSRAQARRVGEWLLYTEQNETETVTFSVALDAGILLRPGMVIEIADPLRAGERRGGRIMAATSTTITLDDDLNITGAAELSVILPDGTIATRGIQSVSNRVVTVTNAFTTLPAVGSIWVIETTDLATSTWRVVSITEGDQGVFQVTALAYNASKFDYIERDVPLERRDVTNLSAQPDAPTNLTVNENLYESGSTVLVRVNLSFSPVQRAAGYVVAYKAGEDNWITLPETTSPEISLPDAREVRHYFRVQAVSSLGVRSSTAEISYEVIGKTAVPVNVSGVSLLPIDQASAIISWTQAPDLDVRVGGKVLIRHTPLLVGALWEEANEIVPSAAGNQTQKQVPLLEGTYLLKFEDSTGNRSSVATTIVTDLPEPQPRLLVQTYAEDQETPPFQGNYTDMFYSEALDGLVISTGLAVDSMATDNNWDGLASIDSVGGVLSSGEYEFGSTLSLPGTFDVNLLRRFVTRPYLPGDLWDDHLDLIDTWDLIDGAAPDRVNARLYVRSTPDDPAGTPTWSSWREFSNALVRGRGFQFKVQATSDDPTQNIVVDELGCVVEMQQRIEQSATLTSPTATYSVTFGNNFYQAPSVGITALNMGTGDYFQLGSVTRTGFQVTFRNSAGSAVARNFTYTAVGHGKEV